MGIAERLIDLERQFAPAIEKGPGVFSKHDRNGHAPWNLGGDKMAADRNGYGQFYADIFETVTPTSIVELGVFRGVSLAVWRAMWPDIPVLGLDLDLNRYREHEPTLRGRGAFDGKPVHAAIWDAYEPDLHVIRAVVGDEIGVFVDDGPHTADAIRIVAEQVGPMVSQAYVLEDFPGGEGILREMFDGWEIRHAGRISAAVRR